MTEKEKYVLEHYQITKDGHVFSNMNTRFKGEWVELKLREDKDGYYDVGLVYNDNGDRQPFRVHRLIALKYIPQPKGYNVTNHKDLNKKNNNVNNLEWSTVKKNTQHGFDNCAYDNIKKVKCIENNNITKVFPNISSVSRYYGYTTSATIQQKLSGITQNPSLKGLTAGFYFEYTEDDVTHI